MSEIFQAVNMLQRFSMKHSSKHYFNSKGEAQEFNKFFAANVKKWGLQSRLTLIVINRSLIFAFNLYINKITVRHIRLI